MAELKIKFSVPDSVYKYRWSNLKKYFGFKLFPPKCSVCGQPVNMKHPYVRWKDPSARRAVAEMMGEATVENDYSAAVCKECVVDAVMSGTAVPKNNAKQYHEYETREQCDHCGTKTTAYKWTAFHHKEVTISLILGNHCSWNSAHYCKECITEMFVKGEDQSHVIGAYKGKYVPHYFGLPVVGGKVRFPER